MVTTNQLQDLAKEHGTPLFIVDHDEIRENFKMFRGCLPRVRPFFAIKANSDPGIVHTLFQEGADFDVASLPEFKIVYENIKDLSCKERHDWVHDKVIYSNTIKTPSTLQKLDGYKPLVTFDNSDEIHKIKEYAPNARLLLRLCVPNRGAMVELSSKFGANPDEAIDLIFKAVSLGLVVEGISFHVGSQTSDFSNYINALTLTDHVFQEAKKWGYSGMHVVDIGGGFPAAYDDTVKPLCELSRTINTELAYRFGMDVQIIAEPGRFMVASACYAVSEVIGVATRNGKKCYYVNDGVYHTYSGKIFDHCHYHMKAFKEGPSQISTVYGPCCDALDMISNGDSLPELFRGDLLYSDMVGAYTTASATHFNGFPPAKIVHINQ
jgi:ornithine decarboxylase